MLYTASKSALQGNGKKKNKPTNQADNMAVLPGKLKATVWSTILQEY